MIWFSAGILDTLIVIVLKQKLGQSTRDDNFEAGFGVKLDKQT